MPVVITSLKLSTTVDKLTANRAVTSGTGSDVTSSIIARTSKKCRPSAQPRRRITPVPLDSSGRPVFPIELGSLTVYSLGEVCPWRCRVLLRRPHQRQWYVVFHWRPVGVLLFHLRLGLGLGLEFPTGCWCSKRHYHRWPHAGSGVVRIDPLHFLAWCHTRRLNQV